MERHTGYRLVFLLTACLFGAVLSAGFVSSMGAESGLDVQSEGDVVAPPGNGITVVATDSNTVLGRDDAGPRASAQLVAIGPDGSILYLNDSHTRYWDVDPVEGTNATVEYLYSDHLDGAACGGDTVCTRNGIERVNLTTGEVTDIYSHITPGKHSTRWHDADRINDTRIAVAGIAADRVFVVDTETGLVEWQWSAQSAFETDESGGPYPSDWTHLNDVEVLEDGRIMVSLRNQDQVVFLDRETGMVDAWTLGSDGDHETLYEQHNPDYIPEEQGGPALLVADSENNRVVEYQRANGSWTRTWSWQDDRLQWPRDADRLPNGHTLITDSNGNRVFEVDEQGTVVWSYDIAFPYEAERLGTGDESTNGPSSERAGLASASPEASSANGTAASDSGAFGVLSGGIHLGPLPNAVAYVLPIWMGMRELLALVGLCFVALGWGAAELRWATDHSVRHRLRRWRERR